ncbi:MAG: hypothetical protein K2F80_04470, partial [Muribaculaceae bacterium]|nr:hypothetical protein [Muribaculaceae bacterium]
SKDEAKAGFLFMRKTSHENYLSVSTRETKFRDYIIILQTTKHPLHEEHLFSNESESMAGHFYGYLPIFPCFSAENYRDRYCR